MKLNLSSKKILIVEDYPVMRKAIKDMLGTLEIQNIAEADNGLNALKEIARGKFDVILCDYNLGNGKNGQQVLEEARLRKILPFTTVFIIISSEQAPGMVLGAMENKPDEYLTKPFNALQLLTRLQKNFRRKEYLHPVEREIDRGNLALAIHHCDRLLNEDDKRMRMPLLKIRGELALNVGDLTKAGEIYHEVLAERELPWARLGLGIIDLQRRNLDQAIATFEGLIHSNPLFMDSYDWLSKAYQADEQPLQAQEILTQAVDLSPTSILRQKKLAATADQNNNVDIAEQAYKTVVKLGKHSIHKSSSDFSSLAKLYSKTHASKQALKTLDDMRQEYINNPEAELRAATLETELYQQLGDDKLSRESFAKVRTLSEELGKNMPKDLQLDLVKACFLNDDQETADHILESLIKNHIDDDQFMDDIRTMQSSVGRDNHSEILIQKTKQELIDINNQGVSLFKQGKSHEAMTLLERAAAKMPKNKTIILNMARIALHDLKTAGPSEEKILLAHSLLKRAKQVGVAHDKIGTMQMEFSRLTHARPANNHDAA
ncbi:response regulator [Methylomarinum sp. Ch1-1]|uniref:Response regulator n=1 Tax=Methylomarinum roseum TaxID=3067653 RepID=A0AAU7NUK6_9GAMM